MKFIYVLGLLLTLNANAALKVENGEILPFSGTNYSVRQLIQDFADLMGLNATWPADLIPEKETLHVQLNTKASKEEFKKIFVGLLDSLGYSAVFDDEFLWISNARDIRYTISPVFVKDDYPREAIYSTVIHRLRYPLSSEVSRNLRPFLSRYGRVIDFSDARAIVLHDKGDNIERLMKLIAVMDTEVAYKRLLTYVPKKQDKEEGEKK